MLRFFLVVWLLLHKTEAKNLLKSEHIFEHETNHVNQSALERGKVTKDRFDLTYPGTKWCGPGNTAASYDELGKYKEEDKCCRDHDHCDNIASGDSKYGLTNNDTFTRLHCQCDKEFKDCLKATKSKIAQNIGTIYFLIRDKCYKEYYPILNCAKEDKRLLFTSRCVRYIFDTSKPIKYQWFDLPFYSPQPGNGTAHNKDGGDFSFENNRIN